MRDPLVGQMAVRWHFEWVAILIILVFLYLAATGSLNEKYGKKDDSLSIYRKTCFFIGLFFVFISKATPLHDIGMSYLFSAHMAGMALDYLVIPPLLLLGMPAWPVRKLLSIPLADRIITFMTKPLIIIIFFNLFFSLYHVPLIFNTAAMHPPFHVIFNLILTVLSYFLWWPIICPVPEKDYLSELQKMGCIFANSVLLTPACALIIFGSTPLYQFYQHTPHILPHLSIVEDQQFGGTIMKIVQEIVNALALGLVFYQWMKKQQEQDRREASMDIKGYKYLEVSPAKKLKRN
ncbi:putative membrane protein [Scopulibacillus daqui]|uniref:Membrane protein n=1 Tax=Scopulibacillus daqui TaxID=1469162 RepID=A0ABS2PX03_9BACL|nr:cytochrome c oxidase assembly protein [Scopulibacillus daqui]MBM7644230.1 putative membrane protein [Scopulibacillus daqui]